MKASSVMYFFCHVLPNSFTILAELATRDDAFFARHLHHRLNFQFFEAM